jgi:hypothetical protein
MQQLLPPVEQKRQVPHLDDHVWVIGRPTALANLAAG